MGESALSYNGSETATCKYFLKYSTINGQSKECKKKRNYICAVGQASYHFILKNYKE